MLCHLEELHSLVVPLFYKIQYITEMRIQEIRKNVRLGNSGEYILVVYPFSQSLIELDGFDENSSLADSGQYGSAAYFVSKNWLEGNNLL